MQNPDGVTVFFKYGTKAQNAAYRGGAGEVTIDIETPAIIVHNGVKVGGTPMPSPNHTHSNTNLFEAGDGIKIDGKRISVRFGTENGTAMAGDAKWTFAGDVDGSMENNIVSINLKQMDWPANHLGQWFTSFIVDAQGRIVDGKDLFPNIGSAGNGAIPVWDSEAGVFRTNGTLGSLTLNALTDVTIANKLPNQVLIYNITNDDFINSSIDMSFMSDVNLSSRIEGSTFRWNSTTSKFEMLAGKAAVTKSGAFTLSFTENNQVITANGDITIPLNSATALPIGFSTELRNMAAERTLILTNGVTVNGLTFNVLIPIGVTVRLTKTGTDAWVLEGLQPTQKIKNASSGFTLSEADYDKLIYITSGVVTIPLNTAKALPIGWHCRIFNASGVSFQYGMSAGITFNGIALAPTCDAQSLDFLVKVGTDAWMVASAKPDLVDYLTNATAGAAIPANSNGKLISTTANMTIPLNSTTPFPNGWTVKLYNNSSGTLNLAAVAGVTLNGMNGGNFDFPAGAMLEIIKVSINGWIVRGQSLLRKNKSRTGASPSFSIVDLDSTLLIDNNIALPADATLGASAGFHLRLRNSGASPITISAGAGATFNGTATLNAGAICQIVKTAANTWEREVLG